MAIYFAEMAKYPPRSRRVNIRFGRDETVSGKRRLRLALERDENSGEPLKLTDFTFSATFLEKHFEVVE
jgi:hypothetical protein